MRKTTKLYVRSQKRDMSQKGGGKICSLMGQLKIVKMLVILTFLIDLML